MSRRGLKRYKPKPLNQFVTVTSAPAVHSVAASNAAVKGGISRGFTWFITIVPISPNKKFSNIFSRSVCNS